MCKFSWRQIDNIFLIFFPRKLKRHNLHEISNPVFLGKNKLKNCKNKKIISTCHRLNILPSMLSVNVCLDCITDPSNTTHISSKRHPEYAFFRYFSEKIRFDFSCESSARTGITGNITLYIVPFLFLNMSSAIILNGVCFKRLTYYCTSLTVTTLWANSADDKCILFFFFLIFPENWIWHFMLIVSN